MPQGAEEIVSTRSPLPSSSPKRKRTDCIASTAEAICRWADLSSAFIEASAELSPLQTLDVLEQQVPPWPGAA